MKVDQFNAILEHIENGFSLRQACKDVNINPREFYAYMDSEDDLVKQYTRAREAQAEAFAQEIVDIADTEEDPNRARIRIDARKWVAAKLKPRVYGDIQKVEHSGGVTLGLLYKKKLEEKEAITLERRGIEYREVVDEDK